MPKLRCPCGFIHDLTPIPDSGWRTYLDVDSEKDCGARAEGLLYECPQCGRLMWRKPGNDQYETFTPERDDQHSKAIALAVASEFEWEQSQTRDEAVRLHNEAAAIVASRLKTNGLTCPHCLQFSREMQFIDRSALNGWSFFQCPICSRTFRLEKFKGSNPQAETESS
jgi:hypothetical protein